MSDRSGPVGIGVIGAGVISNTYLENLTHFADTEVLAVGDLFPAAAERQAKAHGVAAFGDVATVLDHPGVELVINLTIPAAHAEVAAQAVAAGKHVWNEKPLALDRPSAQALLDQADAAGLRVGCAPDTILGEGLQTARRVIERGDIGTPLTGLILLQTAGPDVWHPNPAFLFGLGAGPLFDMGPYYLTALMQAFGPVAQVAAVTSKPRERRVIGSGPKAGEEFDVVMPTHVGALLQFESGQSAQATFSFDSGVGRTVLEVNGTEATMLFPDPNTFGGEIKIQRRGTKEWETVESTTQRSARGTGALDMARAIREGRPHRARGELAYHVLDTMLAISEAGESGGFTPVESTTAIPDLLPVDWDPDARTV
jgi:predicted dehydrogenase